MRVARDGAELIAEVVETGDGVVLLVAGVPVTPHAAAGLQVLEAAAGELLDLVEAGFHFEPGAQVFRSPWLLDFD